MKWPLLSVLLITSGLYAQVFHKDFDNNEVATLNEENYVIISHATSFWDEDSSSKNGVKNLVKFANHQGITSLAAVHEEALTSASEASKYFVKQTDVNYVYFSDAGQHKFQFPNIKNAFIAGGNLTLCLCETIRDIARGAQDKDNLNMVLVKDAIYDWEKSYDNIGVEFIDQFVVKFFIPHFMCPWQNWHDFPEMNMEGLRLDVYSEDKLVKKYDLEPADTTPLEGLDKVINVRFVSSQNLKKTFSKIK